MTIISKRQWDSLVQWQAIAFLVAGLIFIPKLLIEAADIVRGTERFAALARVFLGIGWTAGFVGLLGLYPSLAKRSWWLARIGAVFSIIGAITMTVMAAVSLGYVTNLFDGEVSDVLLYFIPGIFGGIVFGFGAFAVASLKAQLHSRSIGLLLLLLPLTFLFNLVYGFSPAFQSFTGFDTSIKSVVIIAILTLAMFGIGYLLRADDVTSKA